MRLRRRARLALLAVAVVLGSRVCYASPNNVDLEDAHDGGSGSQRIFYNAQDSRALESTLDQEQKRMREGV